MKRSEHIWAQFISRNGPACSALDLQHSFRWDGSASRDPLAYGRRFYSQHRRQTTDAANGRARTFNSCFFHVRHNKAMPKFGQEALPNLCLPRSN